MTARAKHTIGSKGGASHRRLPIPSPSYRVSDCGRFCWGYYRKRDGTLGDDAKLDLADVAIWAARKWREGTGGYLVANVYDETRPAGKRSVIVPFHRLVVRTPDLLVDHRYGNKKDCRRAMLRPATHQQNSANRRKDRQGKLSRFKGVTLHKRTGKWQAQAKHQDKFIHGGLHVTEEAAALAYNAIARRVWGRFSVQNRVTPRMLADGRRKARSRLLRSAKVSAAPSGAKAAA